MKRNCEFCNIEFNIKSNWPKQRFCSKLCANKAQKKLPPNYSVKTLCKCGCGQFILNPDDHARFRKFIPEHRNSGGTHPRLGFKEDESHVESRIKSVRKHFRQKEPTCIEKELYEYLDSKNIEYIKQKQIGRFIPDAFIPKMNLCIFADGKYWHTKPDVIERDKRANEVLKSKGFNVIRLPSKDNGYHLNLTDLHDII